MQTRVVRLQVDGFPQLRQTFPGPARVGEGHAQSAHRFCITWFQPDCLPILSDGVGRAAQLVVRKPQVDTRRGESRPDADGTIQFPQRFVRLTLDEKSFAEVIVSIGLVKPVSDRDGLVEIRDRFVSSSLFPQRDAQIAVREVVAGRHVDGMAKSDTLLRQY